MGRCGDETLVPGEPSVTATALTDANERAVHAGRLSFIWGWKKIVGLFNYRSYAGDADSAACCVRVFSEIA